MAAVSSSQYSSTFKIGGLVSGLKTDDIISQLLDIEKKPIKTIENKKAAVTTKLTAWREMNTRMQALQSTSEYLKNSSTFQARTVTSSDTNILTATASAGNSTASQTVTVKELAQSHQIASQVFTSDATTLGTGTFTIKVGTKEYAPITLSSPNNSLSDLKSAINSGDYGVTANIAKIDDDKYRLVLTSKTSGANGAITISSTLAGGTAPDMSTTLQEAKNAHIVLGSAGGAATPIDIYSSTNTITGVIDGVTTNLVSKNPDKAVNISMSNNSSSVRSNITAFIDQFNNMVDYFSNQFFFDADTKKTGTLFSSTELMQVKNGLYSAVTDIVRGSGKYHSLMDIGIGLDKAGKLQVQDEAKLSTALQTNLEEVKKFFTTPETGLGVKINNFITGITDPTKGIIKTTDDYFTSEIKSLEDTITAKNERLARLEVDYYKKFGKLESMMSKLQSQGSYLGMQIAQMTGSSGTSGG